MLQRFIDKIAEKVAVKLAENNKVNFNKIIEQLVIKQTELLNNVIIKSSNTKQLSDTGLIITYYIGISGLSKATAEEAIGKLSSNFTFSEEEIAKMGVKFVKQFFIPIGESSGGGQTRVEITTV